MSIQVHKTGLSKTLGQKSDGIVTADLVGHWDPSVGVETLYWDNQVSGGENLRRFNGITHTTTDPDHFSFDGIDDYLGGASTGYGGSAFTVNAANAFTLSQWIKGSDYVSNGMGYPFVLEEETGENEEYLSFQLYDGYLQIHMRSAANSHSDSYWEFGVAAADGGDATGHEILVNGKWIYITVTHDGSGNYKCYKNGSYMGTIPMGKIDGSWALKIGYDSVDPYYMASVFKLGHVHIYESELTNSQIRQNFLASHDINNTRIYGDTFGA